MLTISLNLNPKTPNPKFLNPEPGVAGPEAAGIRTARKSSLCIIPALDAWYYVILAPQSVQIQSHLSAHCTADFCARSENSLCTLFGTRQSTLMSIQCKTMPWTHGQAPIDAEII